MDREDCIRINCSLMQAASPLLGEPHLSNDELTHKEVYEQAQGCKKDGLVGNRT